VCIASGFTVLVEPDGAVVGDFESAQPVIRNNIPSDNIDPASNRRITTSFVRDDVVKCAGPRPSAEPRIALHVSEYVTTREWDVKK
jgi:hypothetical protein